VIYTLASAGEGQLGGFVLVFRIACAKAEFQPALDELGGAGHISCRQRWFVVAGVQYERAQPRSAGDFGGGHQSRKRCWHIEMVRHQKHVVA
jgi:hypothetical protein